MSHPEYDDLIALHALGALDGDDAKRLDAHLRTGCAECSKALDEARGAASALAYAAPHAAPPAGARERLMARVRTEARAAARPAPRRRMQLLAPLALVTSLAAMLFLGVKLSQMRDVAIERERVIELLARPSTPRLVMKSGDAAVASAVYDAERHAALVFAGSLPAAPAGKTHVLWILPKDGAAPRNVGALEPSADLGGAHVLRDAPPFSEIAGLAVSEETDPRTATPTKVIAAGTL